MLMKLVLKSLFLNACSPGGSGSVSLDVSTEEEKPEGSSLFSLSFGEMKGRLAEGTGLAPIRCLNTFLQKGIRLPKACLKWVPTVSPAAGSLSTHPACPGGQTTLGAELKFRFSPFQVLWDPGGGCGLVGAVGDPCPPPVKAQFRKGVRSLALCQLCFYFGLINCKPKWCAESGWGLLSQELPWHEQSPPGTCSALCTIIVRERRSYFSASGYWILPVLHINNQILTQKCQSPLRADKEA